MSYILPLVAIKPHWSVICQETHRYLLWRLWTWELNSFNNKEQEGNSLQNFWVTEKYENKE